MEPTGLFHEASKLVNKYGKLLFL